MAAPFDWKSEQQVSTYRLAARCFVESKRRLPDDFEELEEWLMQFAHIAGDMLVQYETLMREHMATCVRPLFHADEQAIQRAIDAEKGKGDG